MACMMHMPGSIKGEFSGAANPSWVHSVSSESGPGSLTRD